MKPVLLPAYTQHPGQGTVAITWGPWGGLGWVSNDTGWQLTLGFVALCGLRGKELGDLLGFLSDVLDRSFENIDRIRAWDEARKLAQEERDAV